MLEPIVSIWERRTCRLCLSESARLFLAMLLALPFAIREITAGSAEARRAVVSCSMGCAGACLRLVKMRLVCISSTVRPLERSSTGGVR